jgi:hypothetical protein
MAGNTQSTERTKILMRRLPSEKLKRRQKQVLWITIILVIAMTIFLAAMLYYMSLGKDGDLWPELGKILAEKLLDDPLEVVVFFVACLVAIAQVLYVKLAANRERLTITDLGIEYRLPLTGLAAIFNRYWRLRWAQIKTATVSLTLSPQNPILVISDGRCKRRLFIFQWIDSAESDPFAILEGRILRINLEEAHTLIKVSPLIQQFQQHGIEVSFPDTNSAIHYALEKNPYTLGAIIASGVLGLYALIDSVALMETYADRPPWEIVISIGLLGATLYFIWWKRVTVSKIISVTLSVILGVFISLAAYPGLLRVNLLTDSGGLVEYRFYLESRDWVTDAKFVLNGGRKYIVRLHPQQDDIPFLELHGNEEYWEHFMLESEHVFVLRKGSLGFYQVNLEPYFQAVRNFYKEERAEKAAMAKESITTKKHIP